MITSSIGSPGNSVFVLITIPTVRGVALAAAHPPLRVSAACADHAPAVARTQVAGPGQSLRHPLRGLPALHFLAVRACAGSIARSFTCLPIPPLASSGPLLVGPSAGAA